MNSIPDNQKPLPGTKEYERVCKILISHTYSQDGRTTESLMLSYETSRGMDTGKSMNLFLLEKILDTSPAVSWYRTYDEFGKALPASKDPGSKRK
jgi:hypothetical protein